VPFISSDHANIAKDVIGVDKELQGHAVKREMVVEGDELVAYVQHHMTPLCLSESDDWYRTFQTSTVRLARLTINAFLENVELIARTLDEFGPDAALSSTN
jgi:EKC/KEOPS complex subunit PCC1/LAGE3